MLIFVKTLFMLDSPLFLSILIGLALVALLLYFFYPRREAKPAAQPAAGGGSNSLQLQAYERLTLLVDRISIPNLISRAAHHGLTAYDMQLLFTKTIREEFDYNITQQIYVTPETWSAVKSLKEKNLLTINQICASLPPTATGLDLNRALLEFSMNDSKANQADLVSKALSYEAKKLL